MSTRPLLLTICPRLVLLCAALAALAQLAIAQAGPATDKPRSTVPNNINERFLDPQLDAEEWIGRFEIESREVYAHRDAIVAALGLKKGARIADVGAGTGLFLQPFSKQVAQEGKVYALDISPKLVEYMTHRVKQRGLDNVEVVLSKEDSTQLAKASVDVVFLCDTYHHFEYHQNMLRSIHDSLREGGQLVIIDFERIPGESSEWILGHVRAGKEQVTKEIQEAGFELAEEVEFDDFQENYFLRFRKPATPRRERAERR